MVSNNNAGSQHGYIERVCVCLQKELWKEKNYIPSSYLTFPSLRASIRSDGLVSGNCGADGIDHKRDLQLLP